ncbi:acyltransferase [Erythrobacter sp. THAF29]|uniref:acyltransferase family protein n=1 Tax=Erythrobacter sp. THAF29 TaxID=2587851 RepID=UPI001562499E|nr:acyltransferase [Erythrobacter sp. THAF29]
MSEKNIAIQLMRILAASYVAFVHLAFAFADHVGNGLGIPRPPYIFAETAVALFFVVSGYVMVTSSREMFGRPRATLTFWRRRIVRIMPSYWLATLALAVILGVLYARWVGGNELALSLFLIPYRPADAGLPPLPFLWPGWTLFYEMLFYALFGLFIGLGRERTIIAVAMALIVLALVGYAVTPDSAPFFMATRSIGLVFIGGMVLALWRARGRSLPNPMRLAAALAGVAALCLIGSAQTASPDAPSFSAMSGIPAILFALALVGGSNSLPRPRLIDELGNMSYALYLFHVPVAWGWQWLYFNLPLGSPNAWLFLVGAISVTLAFSWLYFRYLERPMTVGLNRLAGSPHSPATTD